MPQIKTEDIGKHDIYGDSDIDVSITIRDRLLKRFKAHELIQVMNIDDERFEWQFLPDHAETNTLTEEGIKVTEREDPELWAIEPGETDVMTGACGFLMIENLYKKVVIKRVGIVEHPDNAKQIKNFNFKDPVRAEQIIDLIFLGKVTPSFNQAQSPTITPVKQHAPVKKTLQPQR